MQNWRHIGIMIRENSGRLCIAMIFGCLPFLLCVLYCAAYGETLRNIYLPASYWNDELFYYKQVEGIVWQGFPQGYFGFNESHARMCSFGVWNPILFLPWVVWGLIFGWKLASPVLCNLIFLTAGLLTFTQLAELNRRQTVSILIMLSVFTPFTRFTLSCVAETALLSATFIYTGLFWAYAREAKKRYFDFMLIIATVLTITRPYFALFALLPVITFWKKEHRGGIKSAVSIIVGLSGYFMMKYWFGAPYLTNHIGAGFLDVLRREGIAAGIGAFGQQTKEAVESLFLLLKNAVRYGNQGGCLYGVFGLLGVSFLVIVWRERKRKDRQNARCAAGMAVIYILMMAAVAYMYNIHNGDRHLLTFILIGILFLGMYSEGICSVSLKILLTGTMIFFFLVKPGTDYDRKVPFWEESLAQEIAMLQKDLESRMVLSEKLSWDNTVIWLSHDLVDGEIVAEQWQQLYALPAGFGINHCSRDYVLEHFDSLNSRYFAVVPGGAVEEELRESGAVFLAGNEYISIWDRNREN